MALSLSKIENALRAVFTYEYNQDNDPAKPLLFSELLGLATTANAANAWANAYRLYAEDATAAGGGVVDPLQYPAAEAALAINLTGTFQLTAVPVSTVATKLADDMSKFWLGDPPATTPIVFATGTVTSTVLAVGALSISLSLHWSPPVTPENNVNATLTAGYFDAFTKLVQVTTPGGIVTLL